MELVGKTAGGRVPVLAGAGGYDTRGVIDLVADMRGAGADGILSVTPYYNRPTPEGIYQHYRAIAESTPLPIVVYNVPGRTGCNVDVGTLCRLADIPNIVGVKEASANMPQMCEICRAVPTGFSVLSGDDLFTVPLLSVGGSGVISVASNEAPEEMSRLVSVALNGDFDTARQLHTRLLPLMQVNFIETNPIPVKAAMAHLGLLELHYRLPMVPPRPDSLGSSRCSMRSASRPTSNRPHPASGRSCTPKCPDDGRRSIAKQTFLQSPATRGARHLRRHQ